MKKLFLGMLISMLVLTTGCTKVEEKGDYKEGTYFGSVEYESYGTPYVSTATIYVNENGKIASVLIDSTYQKDGVITTKQTLKDDYGMKETSANMGVIEGGAEWYEQVQKISDKVVKEQGIDWVKWDTEKGENTYLDLDTISGVTISANTYIKAIEEALKQAK